MRIAATSQSTILPRVPQAPPAPLPPAATGPEGLPATDVARRYGHDLLQVAGAHGLTWGSREPSVLHVDFRDEAAARIAAGLFEPDIDGVRIVVRVGEQVVEVPEHEAAGSAADRVRAIAAMRGIWDTRFAQTTQYQHGRVTFAAIDQATIDRLDPILRDRLSFGWIPETSAPRYLDVRWTIPPLGGSSSSSS